MEDISYDLDSEDLVSSFMACEASPWGGRWTEEKLDAFEKYVKAYLTIMNSYRDKYNWKLLYFDGFAGSGSRIDRRRESDSSLILDFFKDDFLKIEELNVYKGAAERVLSIPQRGFDYYYFIDKDEESSLNLRNVLSQYDKDHKLVFRNSDTNLQIVKLVEAMKKDSKLTSLILLDPFGMQVDWKSIELLKGMHADLWILIPTGVIINRLLDKKGELTHIEKLTNYFGKDEDFLRNYFYFKKQEHTLFGDIEIIEKVKEPIRYIAELYISQLGSIFKHVTPSPLVLYNTRKTPIFHFACASNNKNAIKIANEIINMRQQ